MNTKLVCCLALLALAPSCLAHTFFKSQLTPFGNQEPNAPDASAHLDFYIHQGEAHWTLNITDAEGVKAAQIVFGNPEVYGDEVLTVLDLGEATDFTNTTASFEGTFTASNFTDSYASWTTNGFMANAGLNHLWAVLINDASYDSVILSAPLVHYTPAGEMR